MPLPFFSIPEHISAEVVQKLDLVDFVNFSQVSRQSFDAAKRVKTRFAIENPKINPFDGSPLGPIEILLDYENEELNMEFFDKFIVKPIVIQLWREFFDAFPVRLDKCSVWVSGYFSDAFCALFAELLSRSSSTVNTLKLTDISCSPQALNQLIEIGRIGKMKLNYSNLTSAGINLIIKELLNGMRYIEECTLKTTECLNVDDVLSGISIKHRISSESGEAFEIGNSGTFQVIITDHSVEINSNK